MNIVIGTTSESKINALKKSLKELDINKYNIIPVKAKSNVRDNPINEETKVGAQNRNNFIKEYCETNNIDYDILISIEAGYTKENEDYYIDSFAYAVYKDQTYFGQSPRVRITKDIFNYAYEQNGVICYTDLIKVKVALDDGAIVGMETKSYLSSHRQRQITKPKITIEEAKAKLNPKLEILSEGMAIIPTDWQTELITYEFKGKVGENNFIVYINVENGKEEKVFMIIDTPGGMLAI